MTIFWGRGLTSIHTILLRMLKDECSREKFKLEHSPPEDFALCLWQKKPNVLPIWIAYRLFLFLYFVITFIIMIFFRPEGDIIWYKNCIYVACWAYLIQVLSFGMSFYISVERFVKEKKDPELPPMEKMPWHYKALWLFYTMAASSALAISSMFWFFMYDPKYNSLPFSLVTRAFNSLFVIIDAFLNAIPFRFLHFYIPGAFITLYVSFTVIYQASGGTGNRGQIPIYSILDWRTPSKAVSTVLIYIACAILFHCGMCVVNIMKNWLKKPSETVE